MLKLNKKTIFLLFFILLVSYLTLPNIANAQNDDGGWGWWRPLVPCGKSTDVDTPAETCGFCDIFQMIKNLIDFFTFEIVPPLAAGFFTYAGILFLLSMGNEGKRKKAKEVATKVVVGMLLVYGAWLITSTAMTLFFSGEEDVKDTWWKIECKVDKPEPSPTATITITPTATPTTTVPPGGGLRWNEYNHTSEQFSMFASPELQSFTGCFNSKLQAKGLTATITAVADRETWLFYNSNGAQGRNCFVNYSKPPCGHSLAASCHYGGKNCNGKSYSLDIASTNYGIIEAAKECGATDKDARVEGGNHIHIDAPGADAKCDCPTYGGG